MAGRAERRARRGRDWLSLALAGVLLGLGLGLACSGLFMQLAPEGAAGGAMKHAVSTYLLLLVWTLAMGLVFLFRSGASAWRWLGGANLLAGALLALLLSRGG